MKKVFLLFICLLFPIFVNAEEDKLTIEKMNIYIRMYDMNSYSCEETVDTNITFGDNPNIHYYVKKIPKIENYKYTGDNKSITYNISVKSLDIFSNHYYDYDMNNKDNYIISVGNDSTLLNEYETIKMFYFIEYTGDELKDNKEYHFDIAKSDYDIDKVEFEIILTDQAKRGTIYFSNNGKDYFKNIDGLNYKLDDYMGLKGTYNKTLTKGNSLSIKIILNEKDSKTLIDYREIIVYCSFGIFIIFVLFIILKFINHKKTIKD